MRKSKIVLSEVISSIFPKSENEEEEMATLEESLKEEGCRDNIVIWKEKGVIVDGSRRYSICIKNGIPFEVSYMSFSSLEDAKGWAVKNQVSRRNLNNWQRSSLTVTYRQEHYQKLAEQNKKLSRGRGVKGKKGTGLPFKRVNVNVELGREAGVGKDTMCKARYVIKNGNDKILSKLNSNTTSISKAYDSIRRDKKAIAKAKKAKITHGYINDLSKGVENELLCMDVFDGIKLIDDSSVSLVFSSPPFNVSMKYKGVSDSRPHSEYMGWFKDVFSAIKPKLRSGGRVIFEIENTRVKDDKGKNLAIKYPIEAEIINMGIDLGFIYRDTIQWNKGTVGNNILPLGSYSPSNPCIRNTHSNVIIFSKDQMNLPCVTGDPSILDSDYYGHLTKSTWDINPEHHPYGTHCCPMPIRLARQAIELFSYKGDLVLDPFGGSSTTAVACIRTCRRFIHIDASETYCAEAKQRINGEMMQLQQLKMAA